MLILNAGSSSIKFAVFGIAPSLPLELRGRIDGLGSSPRFRAFAAGAEGEQAVGERGWEPDARLDHAGATEHVLAWLRGTLGRTRLAAAGHRVVHGGTRYDRPVRIDGDTRAALETLVPLAPLHQPHALAAIDSVARLAPDVPQVACFDTAFHRSQPEVAQAFAIPRKYAAEGVRRYGFHGLSYEYIARQLAEIHPAAAAGRTIVAHLGAGASLCAMHGGRSMATTMGFTALDGLVMGTRCGSIDPGVLLYLESRHGLDAPAIHRMLYEESGMLGVSGISGDMRTLLASPSPAARDAVELFVYRAGREIGSLAAALGGVDAIVFTGGIGENAAGIRRRICEASAWLGVRVDEGGNEAGGPRITRPDSAVTGWVIETNEELMIARHTAEVLGLFPQPSSPAAPSARGRSSS